MRVEKLITELLSGRSNGENTGLRQRWAGGRVSSAPPNEEEKAHTGSPFFLQKFFKFIDIESG